MPIFFQHNIDESTRLAIWKIEEADDFFAVPLHRNITHPHKRRQHLAGRYLLRFLFPDFPLELIKIADTRRPYLDGEDYHFSISHCGDYAAAIVSTTKRVGIDIEVPSPRLNNIKQKFLHPDELAAVGSTGSFFPDAPAPGDRLQTELTLLWSAKEAVFKWWSFGSVDFSEMIRLQPFRLQPSGSFGALFHAPSRDWPLELHYRLFNGLCLAWTAA